MEKTIETGPREMTKGLVHDQDGSELQRHRWYALLVISIGTFMTPFTASVVAVALQRMGEDLHLSYSQGLWVQAAYLLVTSTLLIPAGRIADARGPVRCYLMGAVTFGLGSVVAGLAPNGLVLVLARCVQGAGGAFLFSPAAGIVTAAFPARERGRAFGLNVTAVYVALFVAPVVGGVIVTHTSWRWIFFLNVPVAAAAVVLGWSLLGIERRDRRAAQERAGATRANGGEPAAWSLRSLDWPGALLLGGALTTLFIPLTFFPLWGWADARTIGLLGVAVLLFLFFVGVEDRRKEPMLDLDLVRRNRIFAIGNSAALLNSVAIYAVTTLVAVFLEVVQHRTAQETGLVLLVQPVLMALLSPFWGLLSDRVGARVPATIGMVVIAAGMVQLAFASSVWMTVFALATLGVGQPAFTSPNMSAIMGSVDYPRLNVASAFLGAVRFGGQGISIAVLGAIAAWKLGSEGARIILLGESAGSANISALADGFQVAMLAGAGLALAGAVLSWMTKPRKVRKLP